MMSTVASRTDQYRHDAQECWKLAGDADDLESKALFQLTAEAWTMLAAQVESLAQQDDAPSDRAPPLLQSAA
jgi:hypothetical protein